MNGVAPEELVELRSYELPAGCEYLWEWFLRLRDTRTMGMGESAISETELRCFFLNRDIKPTQWELDLLTSMDVAARDKSDEPTESSEPQEE